MLAEFGAPAVDLAGNQPSAFPSDKPGNDVLPFGSRGIRDDAQQRVILDTALETWEQTGTAANPLSPVDNRPMLEPSGIHLWTWDARPYPIFPNARSIWTDGQNWSRGHWLNGRLGAVALSDLILALCAHFDLPPMDVSAVHGTVSGFTLKQPTKARQAFADLSRIYALDIIPVGSTAKVQMRGAKPSAACTSDDLATFEQAPLLVGTRTDPQDLPRQVTLGFSSPAHDHQTGIVRSSADASPLGPDDFATTSVSLQPGQAVQVVERLRQEALAQSNTMRIALPPSFRMLEPGDTITLALDENGPVVRLCIDRVVDGARRFVEAHQIDPLLYEAAPIEPEHATTVLRPTFGAPDVVVLDLPSDDGSAGTSHNVRIAAFADPWPGALSVYIGDATDGFSYVQQVDAPAVTGTLLQTLPGGPVAYPQVGGVISVSAPTGSLSTVSQSALYDGGNLAALVDGNALELIQFQTATLVGDNQYELSGLLRGLGGTEAQALLGMPTGTRFVLLHTIVDRLEATTLHLVNGTTVRVEPAGGGIGAFSRTDVSHQARPRSLEPLAPVHVRSRVETDGSLTVDWMRRTRGLSDLWDLSSLPLNEEQEAYRVAVIVGGQTLREEEVAAPNWVYSATAQTADGNPTAFDVSVRQLGTGGRPGQSATLSVAL